MENPNNKRMSLDERIALAKKMQPQKPDISYSTNIKPIKLNTIEYLNVERMTYIEAYCNKLLKRGTFSYSTIKIIQECMEKYNVKLDKYLEERNEFEYHYTAALIFMMVDSGMFKEEDYLSAGKISMANPFEVFEQFEKIKKEKRNNTLKV